MGKLERRRSEEEDELLRVMYQSSPVDILMAVLPGRSWKGITLRARRSNLRRNRGINKWRSWSKEDDKQLVLYCKRGIEFEEIANKLGRSLTSIAARVQARGSNKPFSRKKRGVSWETFNLISSQQSSSRGGYRPARRPDFIGTLAGGG